MAVFDKCCFCVPLRTGCFILGYLQLVGAVFAMVMSVGMMIMGVTFIDSSKKKEADAAGYIIAIAAVSMVLFLLSFAFVTVLLVGLHKRKPNLIRMYMIYSAVFLVIYFSTLILRVITVWQRSGGEVAGTIINLVLSTYYLLVIRSYYLKLIDEQGLTTQIKSMS